MKWPRAAVMMLVVAVVGTMGTSDLAGGSSDSPSRGTRRRWALSRMDEMANEKRRCAQRFEKKPRIEACEKEYDRKFLEYNEMYLEASRE